MRILQIGAFDRRGGASIAAYRQHQALQRHGVDSRMLVRFKATDDPAVQVFQPARGVARRAGRALKRWDLRRRVVRAAPTAAFASARSEIGAGLVQDLPPADVVNIQFGWDFVDYPDFMSRLSPDMPVVVTMHGLENFTGGCSYTAGCEGFHRACGNCPQLTRRGPGDLSAEGWRLRSEAFAARRSGKLHFVADSHWMADEARKSSLLRDYPVSVIHYGIDTEIFRPLDRAAARAAFGVPAGMKVVGFAADSVSDPRKGVQHLLAALQGMAEKPFLLTWGRDRVGLPDGYAGLHLGALESEYLTALACNAADIFAMPSVEEAFGQTALEALACGTPVAAFAAGGIPDIVRHEKTGLLAKVGDVEALSDSMVRLLGDENLRTTCGERGIVMANEEFSFPVNAAKYVALYESMLSRKK
jgi:glycosyltransferase involved in cell wall biosynthesis